MRYPQPDRREALLSAMVEHGSDRNSPAWRELAQLVDAARRTDTALARLWPPAPAQYAATAEALDLLAARDTATDDAVMAWLRRHASTRSDQQLAPEPELPGHTSNVIGGNSVLHGPSVQARDIHGGVHFHPPSEPPRPPVPRQLPPAHARFVDRQSDRQALDDLRASHPAQGPPRFS